MTRLRAVFLDVGGTLAHPHPSFPALMATVCRRHGVPVTEEEAIGAEPAVWARVAQRDDEGRGFSMSSDRSRQFWLWVYHTFLIETGHPDAAETDLPQRLLAEFVRPENYTLYQDVVPTLDRLQAAGLTLGLISNWERWFETLMVELGLDRYVQFALVSGVAGIEKPDPGIFQRALDEAGVAPHEAVHVGDSLRDDVEGAEAAGIRAILLDRDDRFFRHQGANVPSQERIPTRIRSLLELPPLLGLEP